MRARPIRASRRPRPAFPCQGLVPLWPNLELRPAPALAPVDNAAQPHDIARSCKDCPSCCRDTLRLASLTVDGGLFRQGPDLASLRLRQSYRGLRHLGACGLPAERLKPGGALRNRQPEGRPPSTLACRTWARPPPAVYELKPRERLFHGVQALRMIPAEGSTTNGRSGLLAHSYMLRPQWRFERLRLDQKL